jgi:hypothetical protein
VIASYIWVGEEIQIGFTMWLGFAVWTVLTAVGNVLNMLFYALDKIRIQAILMCIFALVAIIVKILAVDQFSLSGLLWGNSVVYLLFLLLPYGFVLSSVLQRLSEYKVLDKEVSSS